MKILLLFFTVLFARAGFAQEYEVLPHGGSAPRGQIWIGEGVAQIDGGSRAVANRLRAGLRLGLGEENRYKIGFTLLDTFSRGERSAEVGSVKRAASGIELGYEIWPGHFGLNYTYQFHAVAGDRVTGNVGVAGHQIAARYDFYRLGQTNFGIDLSYSVVPSASVPVYDLGAGAAQVAKYPAARILSVGFTVAFDLF